MSLAPIVGVPCLRAVCVSAQRGAGTAAVAKAGGVHYDPPPSRPVPPPSSRPVSPPGGTMKRLLPVSIVLACLLGWASGSGRAQDRKEPGHALISLYRVAPGKHLEFLKWMAVRDGLAREAGLGATQWYAHLN